MQAHRGSMGTALLILHLRARCWWVFVMSSQPKFHMPLSSVSYVIATKPIAKKICTSTTLIFDAV